VVWLCEERGGVYHGSLKRFCGGCVDVVGTIFAWLAGCLVDGEIFIYL